MGCTHVWYTGIIRHASTTSYEEYGIPTQHPAIVKGKAGSPYAIVDYYDVDPDLAENVPDRMQEFEALLSRTSKVGLKTIIDFVPNHVARQYKSTTKPEGVEDLGENDDTTKNFNANNNFYYCNGLPFAPSLVCILKLQTQLILSNQQKLRAMIALIMHQIKMIGTKPLNLIMV